MSMAIVDYDYPNWGYLLDLFAIQDGKIAGMAGDRNNNFGF